MRIVITRAEAQADQMIAALARKGHQTIAIPTILIENIYPNPRLKVAYKHLHLCKWALFTSTNAVEAVMEHITRQRYRQLKHMKIAAVGAKTAQALQRYQLKTVFVPENYIGTEIITGMGDLSGQWIFLPRAETARGELPEAIESAGGVCLEVPVYRNVLPEVPEEQIERLKNGVDLLTFTSPSTVRNFATICKANGIDPLSLAGNPRVVCIGPITTEAARKAGYTDLLTPSLFTTEAMLELIERLSQNSPEIDYAS